MARDVSMYNNSLCLLPLKRFDTRKQRVKYSTVRRNLDRFDPHSNLQTTGGEYSYMTPTTVIRLD